MACQILLMGGQEIEEGSKAARTPEGYPCDSRVPLRVPTGDPKGGEERRIL